MQLNWIDEYVDGLIEHCHSANIFDIYKSLKINISKVGKDNYLLQGNQAMYIRSYLGMEVVFILEDIPYRYEKFVLSHELGHAVLHTELIQAAYNKDLINKGKLEHQADYFALRLLNVDIDELYYEGYTKKQIANDLFVNERSLEYFCK